jgi:acyl-coenzyme A thioesterase PaaI-like protein
MTASPHPATTDTILRRSVTGDGDTRAVTLDARFQGLPDTAHGGTVLALFDALAGAAYPRLVSGVYRRRVPLATPLRLVVSDGATRFHLADGGTGLVEGTVGVPDPAGATLAAAAAPAAAGEPMRLPVAKTCFACGTENALGLGVTLTIDDASVGGECTPRETLRGPDGALATVALTALLDEAAFWLGAAASGESGMTTDLRVRLPAPVAFGPRLVVAGQRAAVRRRADDPRYWDTEVAVWDDAGTLVASAAITFVAVRGAARKLMAGFLAVDAPDVLARVFPAYVPGGRDG